MEFRSSRQPRPGWRVNRAHPLARGLEACFVFNTRGGSVFPDLAQASNKRNLTISDPTFLDTRRPAPFGGVSVGASATNASTGSVAAISPTVSIGAASELSAECLIYPTSSLSFGTIAAQGVSRGLYILSGGNIRLYPQASSTGTVTFNRWNHVVVTRATDGIVKYWINGILSNTTGTGDTSAHAWNTVFSDTLNENWAGSLAHLRVWSRVLVESEVRQLYRQPYAMFKRPRQIRVSSTGGVDPLADGKIIFAAV